MTSSHPQHGDVALRKESVDRNDDLQVPASVSKVALRKESVDRNYNATSNPANKLKVALRKESVDRNLRALECCLHLGGRSPQGERG